MRWPPSSRSRFARSSEAFELKPFEVLDDRLPGRPRDHDHRFLLRMRIALDARFRGDVVQLAHRE